MSTINLIPEDYIRRRVRHRANMLCLALFAVVMTSVVAAAVVSYQSSRHTQQICDQVNTSYAQVTTRPETFIPIVGGFVGGADVKSNAVYLVFGQDGKLMNFSGSASAMGTGMGVASGVGAARTEAQPRQ